MVNSVTTQVINDGSRNYIIKVVGIVNASNVAPFAVVNVATIGLMDINLQPNRVRIERIVGDSDPGLDVILQWDATAPVNIYSFNGHGHDEYERTGGLSNNAGAGITGNVLLSTSGWTTGASLNFTLVIECTKTSGVTV
jgi:hypothetical protein